MIRDMTLDDGETVRLYTAQSPDERLHLNVLDGKLQYGYNRESAREGPELGVGDTPMPLSPARKGQELWVTARQDTADPLVDPGDRVRLTLTAANWEAELPTKQAQVTSSDGAVTQGFTEWTTFGVTLDDGGVVSKKTIDPDWTIRTVYVAKITGELRFRAKSVDEDVTKEFNVDRTLNINDMAFSLVEFEERNGNSVDVTGFVGGE